MKKFITKYLKSGTQTKITSDIKEIADFFNKEGFNLIFEILAWLHKNLRTENSREIKREVFRRRTAQEIVKDGFTTGCTDWALVFIVLVRAKGVPVKYVETIRKRWLDGDNDNLIEGHIFTEVYLNRHWYIVDPEQANIRNWYDEFIIFKKGLDSWNIGINNFDELKKQFLKFRKKYRRNK